MRTRTIFLGGAAVLAASCLGALPGFAQSADSTHARYGNGPQYSTPAEQQATDQLNRQAVNGTTAPPAVLNGEAAPADLNNAYQGNTVQSPGQPSNEGSEAPPAPQASNPSIMVAQDEPSQAQSQYNDQRQHYDDQMQQYRDQQQQYQNERGRYYEKLRAYDLAQYDWYYPHSYAYRYGDEYGLQPLYLMAEPSQQLAQMPVEDPSGHWVGRVRNVETGPGGQPARVEIALNRRVSVWVHPGSLRYDPEDHILFTDLTREKLWDMPGATIESGPY